LKRRKNKQSLRYHGTPSSLCSLPIPIPG
jgi:hypothetical protein